MMAQLQLQGAWEEWGAKRAEAITETDQAKARSTAAAAAQKLISDTNQIIYAETGGFFKNIKPSGPPP
jgi:hypothetical protein